MKIIISVLFIIIFVGTISIYYGIVLDQQNIESKLPIHISSNDFVNGIAFTDLNTIDVVSKESIIIIDGILEYDQ